MLGVSSARGKGHEEGGLAYAKAGSSLGSPPPDILEHLPPKNQSLPFLLLCTLTSDFAGGCPPPPSHSLSLSSRSSLVLHFLHKGGVICISEVIDISPSNLDF